MLPLALVLANGAADDDGVALLVEANPTAAGPDGRTALHLVVAAAAGQAAEVRTRAGVTN